MKKSLIIMLAVLMAVTVISCEKDKSGEMIQNFEDFKNAEDVFEALVSEGFSDELEDEADAETYAVTLDISDLADSNLESVVEAVMEVMADVENLSMIVKSVDSKAGTISGTYKEDNQSLTFSDFSVAVKYDVKEYSGSSSSPTTIKENEEFTLEISGTYKYSVSAEGVNTLSTALTINGKSYNVESVYRGPDYERKYTVAKINGNDVNLKILNAVLSGS